MWVNVVGCLSVVCKIEAIMVINIEPSDLALLDSVGCAFAIFAMTVIPSRRRELEVFMCEHEKENFARLGDQVIRVKLCHLRSNIILLRAIQLLGMGYLGSPPLVSFMPHFPWDAVKGALLAVAYVFCMVPTILICLAYLVHFLAESKLEWITLWVRYRTHRAGE